MKKNTRTTRNFKALNTRFNVYFNGQTSYELGLKKIAESHSEDYSAIIPLYPISHHENANSAKSDMDRSIEKSRKAIKLYSIKQKPERNLRKWSDPEYRLWYNQNEFNPELIHAWMLLAKSEFHKADFIGSVGTFTYIARHYSHDKDVVAQCQLWMARAYGEMGWIYEAEQVLSKIKQDDLKMSNTGLFAAVNADLLLKKKQYREAIPFLELTLKSEKDKLQKQRINYLLAQLYRKTGNDTQAYKLFSEVVKMNPPYEMDFNARIYRAELNPNVIAVRKELEKMLKNPNNKDYHDQIYFTLGKTYLAQGDTVQAMKLYEQSAESSTRNGFDKALTLITLGDLYYNNQNYIQAQPCYDEASKIITVENEDYARVEKRAITLSELVVQHEIVVLQDSLQYLASLPEDKRLETINKVIEKLIADEKAAAEAEAAKANQIDDGPELMQPLGFNQGSGDWYFYNTSIVKTGQRDFRKKWGTRKLEDNWRRTNKSSALFADETITNDNTGELVEGAENDTTNINTASDPKSPEFYLQQIPLTTAAIKKSNAEIADALFSMGMIYKDKVEDYPMAVRTFEEFNKRFPADPRVEESLYQAYIVSSRLKDDSQVIHFKNTLLTQFPASKYAEVLSQPDYSARMERMIQQQDSLYRVTYDAYNRSDFATVHQQVAYMQKEFPLSSLLPKFLFLDALSTGKSDTQDKFEVKLNHLVEKYPESDVSSMSKDIIALMTQGREAKTGTTHGSLLSRREKTLNTEDAEQENKQFSIEKESKHRLLLISSADKTAINNMLFNVAAYNFTRFMVKDFDLVINTIDSTKTSLSVTNFDSYDEALWYLSSVDTDPELRAIFDDNATQKIIVSEENYALLRTVFSLDEYQLFHQSNLAKSVTQINTNSKLSIKKDIKTVLENKPSVTQANTKTEKKATEVAKNNSTQTGENKPATATTNTAPTTTASVNTQASTATQSTTPAAVKDDVPLFKNLFAYREKEEHFVAIAVMSGNYDFEQFKAGLDTYHQQNYSVLNLKIQKEEVNKMQVIIIGPFADANIAKSYLFRIVRENAVMAPVKGTEYRNLLGSKQNLNVMMQQNAMNIYFEFMQQYYLK
ncbi:MAG: tetratricopeptide repeat protein [Paludibacteraceae bacterium]|nr:tetratricopeptide repeat protein [Paludibacteraceae bacterium]